MNSDLLDMGPVYFKQSVTLSNVITTRIRETDACCTPILSYIFIQSFNVISVEAK